MKIHGTSLIRWRKARLLLFPMAAGVMLASTLFAGNPKTRPKQTPPLKPKADTILAVSADSITVRHTKIQYPTSPKGKPGEVASNKTYKINAWTEVLINGDNSNVSMLKPGMTVNVQGEATSGSLPGDSNILVATEISAFTNTAQ